MSFAVPLAWLSLDPRMESSDLGLDFDIGRLALASRPGSDVTLAVRVAERDWMVDRREALGP